MSRNKKIIKMIVIICQLYFVVACIASISLYMNYFTNKQRNEANTKEFTGTIKDICMKNEKHWFTIYTEEFDVQLLSMYEGDFRYDPNSLKKGQIIIFRIDDINLGTIVKENSSFCPIVSLKTPEKEVYSLSDYNENKEAELYSMRIFAIVAKILFLFVSIYGRLLLKRIDCKNKEK